MSAFSPAQPVVLFATSISPKTIDGTWSYATFTNMGSGNGTIDFGDSNVATLEPKASLTMPYLGRPYGTTVITAPATTIQIIFVR